MIKPTVGRIVHFYPAVKDADAPLAAIITHVWSDRQINITVFGRDGITEGRTSVYLAQPNEEVPAEDRCEWMPYQVKKDFGSESGEKEVGIQTI